MATEVAEVDVAITDRAGPSGQSSLNTTKRRRFRLKKNPEDQSRRPSDNKWFQQQIPACRPVFTAVHAFVGFLIIGIAFLILGSIFTALSSQLRQFEVSYEGCGPITSDNLPEFSSCETYLDSINDMPNFERLGLQDCHCLINLTLPEDIRPSWNMYYGMRNYYQNHRRYLNSWDVNQLRGDVGSFQKPTSDCRPYVNLRRNESDESEEELPVVPCGLIANSFFNDSFDVFTGPDGNEIKFNRTNIAWQTDRSVRFQNPDGAAEVSPESLEDTIMPPNWSGNLSTIPGGLQNESLMVWFRVSAFPWFKKLYGRPAVQSTVLTKGNYSFLLTYNYPVSGFNGKKSILFAEVNWLGGRNLFLGIAYLVVGAFLVIAAFVLLLMHKLCSKWKLDQAPFANN